MVHLVSTWPFPVLNLNDVEIPFADYLQRDSPHSQCVADFVIKGLFYRKVKFCRLQMLVLPKDTREGLSAPHSFYKLIYNAPRGRKFRGAGVSSCRDGRNHLPVLIAPTHGGMARLSGPEWPG